MLPGFAIAHIEQRCVDPMRNDVDLRRALHVTGPHAFAEAVFEVALHAMREHRHAIKEGEPADQSRVDRFAEQRTLCDQRWTTRSKARRQLPVAWQPQKTIEHERHVWRDALCERDGLGNTVAI